MEEMVAEMVAEEESQEVAAAGTVGVPPNSTLEPPVRTIPEPAGSHSAAADPLTLSASGLELLAAASSVLSEYKPDSLSVHDHAVKRSTAASPESWVSSRPEFFLDWDR